MRAELIVLSAISFVLVLIPLPWHWRARNVATLTTIVWIAGDNLIHLVNSIVWSGNVVNRIPVWCDITTKFFIGSWIGIPCAALCLVYHLESVASTRFVTRSSYDRRKRLIAELGLCVGVPVLIMCLHPLVQGHRYDIMEDFGCQFNIYWSWPALLLIYLPAMVVSIIAFVYAILALRAFMQRRAQFKEVLASSQSGLNTSRYLRLMGMAVSTLSCCIAFSIYVIVTEFSFSPLRIYDSWADVHFNFSRVGQFPRELMPDWYWQKFENAWMIVPVAGFIFFFFFGFGEEATREYKRYIRALRRHVLRQDVGDGTFLGESTFAANTSTHLSTRPHNVTFPSSSISHTSSKNDKWDDGIDLPEINTSPEFDSKKLADEEAAIGLDVPPYTPTDTNTNTKGAPRPPSKEVFKKGHASRPSSDTLTLPPPPSAPRSNTRPPRTPRVASPPPTDPRNSCSSPPQPEYPVDQLSPPNAPQSPLSASPAPVSRVGRPETDSIALSFDESIYPIGEGNEAYYREEEDGVFHRAARLSMPPNGRTPRGAVVITVDRHVQ